MTDRELLEAAAKAAGIEVWWNGRTCFVLKTKVATHEWDPLTDDGDALRLAVKLSLLIAPIPYQPGINAYGAVGVSWPGQRFDLDYERFTNDPYAATRRAIVRAAAEIGRNMK